ncbi:uncharacterized protein N7479_009886 [Penicillium vulpinum]|uniref:Uncharacterized protein n=1 Tax=Penicillium vulpinum TaxID=29845 RepID=A0A1V6RYF3_9EURO|nr:uncharacterized protein N7479_009886 [Penicillium vulpinum]KAJ5951473.1 hypothetical protein N7479_009886 [Penicillium vulpinum]OQE06514.1 hypothetical protein PENVUL_c017G00729 [Penicillium vulpinum]
MAEDSPRKSIVEDVFIPKELLTTAKFNSPWELARWEQSLPDNNRISLLGPRTSSNRPLSLSSLRAVTRPKSTIRSRGCSDPPAFQGTLDYFANPASSISDKEPIPPVQNAFISPRPLSKFSPHKISSEQSSLQEVYEKAKLRGAAIQRKHWVRLLFEYSFYSFLVLFAYFVLVGMPLWEGAVWWLYYVVRTKFVIQGGYSIVIGLAALYAFCPLMMLFEKDPPTLDSKSESESPDLESNISKVKSTALLIPCYKSATIIDATLQAAFKVFPKENIFVIANGNSKTPLDNTEEVCKPYGINYLWVPIGSKIVAQFVGSHAAKDFENALLIDDDCLLPPNFPIVSDRLKNTVKCLGYTIKSVGPNSSKGTFCQQAQDLEYKMSGIQRAFFGMFGSATFPHGAISLWNIEFLKQTFHEHPGFSVSEDWFFGDACRRLGGRITMCSQVFVETETPASVFWSGSGGSRGGFGEMTVLQQRFKRWNFFFVVGVYYDLKYILTSWKLGWWEFGAKLCVFQEVYETLIYLFAPFILPISFIVRPSFCGMLLGVTIGMYILNVIIFNEIHLRLKKERINWKVLLFYYTFYKIALTFINVVSCYWSLYKYARYFAQRHPKVIEDRDAVEVILSLEKDSNSRRTSAEDVVVPLDGVLGTGVGRKLTLTKVKAGKKREGEKCEKDTR